MIVPERLVALTPVLGLSDITESLDLERNPPRRSGWTAARVFTACWPIPDGSVSFGKGSSCVVGEDIGVSCVEVELALAARNAGWEGGWVRGYALDSRFPATWRRAVISRRDACSLLSREFNASRFAEDDGFPDLVLALGSTVVRAECKRLRDRWWDNTGAWKVFGGDSPTQSQIIWNTMTRRAKASPDGNLTIAWTRLDASPFSRGRS